MSLGLQLFLAFAFGGGLGWLIGSLMARGKQTAAPSDQRLENELREQLDQRTGELTQLRSETVSTKTSLATAQANLVASENLRTEQKRLHDCAQAEAKESQVKALADLREAFKALSADALKQIQPDFLERAKQTLATFQEAAKGDFALRQEAIKGWVEPLKQQLDNYQQRLQQSETAQADTLGKVKEQLTALASSNQTLEAETAKFRSVLSSNQARGRWGEETLRRVVESAGMSAHCDFTEQKSGDDADKRPDLIVRLPEGRMIIVDSKVPDLDVVAEANSTDVAKRSELLSIHAAKLRQTVKQLSERDYPKQFPTALDHVVLFVPAESLFSTALEGDPELIVWAESKQIYLATPASLIAVLRTIDFVWKQHKQTENAKEIAAAAKDFYSRVVTFTEHFDTIHDGLEKANSAYNKAVSSFQTRVRPAGEKLAELGGGHESKQLADVSPLTALPEKVS
jgi:DNA recombination protein RmuC